MMFLLLNFGNIQKVVGVSLFTSFRLSDFPNPLMVAV